MDPEWVQKVVAGDVESLCTCLPATGGDEDLTIPAPMYRKMLGRPGWLPVCSELPVDKRCEKHRTLVA
jgi:hypothetical protein